MMHLELKNHYKISLVAFIAITIPFLINIGNLAIILASLLTLIFYKRKTYKKNQAVIFFPVLWFVICLISSVLSKDHMYGLRHMDLVLLPVLFVLILSQFNINKFFVKKILTAFFYSCVFFTTILFFHILTKISNVTSLGQIMFHDFTKLYDQHPVYYSMYISLSIFFWIKESFYKKPINYLYLLILILGLIFCASKAVLVFNFVVLLFFVLLNKSTFKTKVFTSIVVFLISILSFQISFIKERFTEGVSFNKSIESFKPTNDFSKKRIFSYEEKTKISDLELRYILGSIGLYHLVKDNKLFTGFGQGDTNNVLNYYYFSYNLGPNWYENFNVHNQYIHILIMYGIFALILFLFYLIYSIFIALKKRDTTYLFFLLLSCFVFIFEVVLVRNKGIVFFFFFNTLFLFKNLQNFENSNIRN